MQALFIHLIAWLTGLGLAWLALNQARTAWRRAQLPVDLAMQIAAGVLALYLLVSVPLSWLAQSEWMLQVSAYVTSIFYQLLGAAVAFLLLTMSGASRPLPYYLTLVLMLSGILMVVMQAAGIQITSVQTMINQTTGIQTAVVGASFMWGSVWLGFHLLIALVLGVVVVRQVFFSRTQRSWLALTSGALALWLWVEQWSAPQHTAHFLPIRFCVLAFVLWVMWHVVSMASDTEKLFDGSLLNFRHSTGFSHITGGESLDGVVALAVGIERRRIAQELHDGIGSQLVNVLSTLTGSTTTADRQTALALEQCLGDLKLTVDAIDGFENSVPEALGRLRHRVQRALDGQGIQLAWKVQISTEIDAFKGPQAQQVLRIAQESVSNVLRHAHATALEVACRYVPEFCHLLLEVRDNGRGVMCHTLQGTEPNKIDHPTGKGIPGMRRRAAAIGGHLLITSKTGVGTTVRLTVPLKAQLFDAYRKPPSSPTPVRA